MRTDRLVREYDVRLHHIMFPLHPDVPDDGMTLAELFGVPEHQLGGMRAKMEKLMADAGLPYGDRTHTYNSRLAQELAVWADAVHPGSRVHQALYEAYFVANTNLARVDALVEIAESAGLPPSGAREALVERSFREAVDANWQRARELGVTGVPTFVVGRQGVVGAQPYEVLEELVTSGGAVKRRKPGS